MPDINAAYRWAIDTCNAPRVGYSMTWRDQQVVNNITYYDCSSFIWYALTEGGSFPIPRPPFATGGMLSALTAAGFQIITGPGAGTVCYPGDILWHNHGSAGGHTEMVFAGGTGEARTMGAHGSSLPLTDQVSINSGYVAFSTVGWEYLARWGSGVEYHWHNKNTGAYARDSVEAQENVMKMVQILAPLGWTINAIAGMIGNIEAECGLNPWRWQNDTVSMSLGYGLFQYTPANKYIGDSLADDMDGYQPNYPTGAGGPDDGTAQLLYMMRNSVPDGEGHRGAQYSINELYPQYGLTFEEYQHSTQTPEFLASAWLHNFERAGVEVESQRRANAVYWYDWITSHPWISAGGNIIPKKRALLYHRKRRLGY